MISHRALIHICCAHCAAYTLQFWQQQGYLVTALWYNPNIHPQNEHALRLQAARELLEQSHIPLIVMPDYEPSRYFAAIRGAEGHRCCACFDLRLQMTAAQALKEGYGVFSTSLLISPHQEHQSIIASGDEIARSMGLVFLYSDLRRRYSNSRVITKDRQLYRQQYCGCIYSFGERVNEQQHSF
jgi:predicted adenine nucleotide alpha hydrolase (AANH) superfamily ATPase